MNRKQLLVVGVVVGLLLVGWMLGHSRYELHRRMTRSWELDPSAADVPGAAAQPADASIDVTVACAGPLASPDERLDVRGPGIATAGFEPWRVVYLEPNPCTAERASRRRALELQAAAVLLLGVVGLVAFRPRSLANPSNLSPPTTEDARVR